MGMDYGIQIHQQYIYDGLLTMRDDKNCTQKNLNKITTVKVRGKGVDYQHVMVKDQFFTLS